MTDRQTDRRTDRISTCRLDPCVSCNVLQSITITPRGRFANNAWSRVQIPTQFLDMFCPQNVKMNATGKKQPRFSSKLPLKTGQLIFSVLFVFLLRQTSNSIWIRSFPPNVAKMLQKCCQGRKRARKEQKIQYWDSVTDRSGFPTTRWSLCYWYLDFSVNHQRKIVQQCARSNVVRFPDWLECLRSVGRRTWLDKMLSGSQTHWTQGGCGTRQDEMRWKFWFKNFLNASFKPSK